MKKYLFFILFWFAGLNLPISAQQSQISGQQGDLYSAQILQSWNDKILQLAISEDGLLTLKGVRTLSMMHIAIHNALNTIDPIYATYAFDKKSDINCDPLAAVASAAYQVSVSQFPDKKDELKDEFNRWIDPLTDRKATENGILLGIETATEIVRKRENDHWNNEAEYTWHPMAPGVYAEFNKHSGTPQGFIFGAGWAKAKPFVLPAADFFRASPPPQINSDAYSKAFNEVKTYGIYNSTKRSEDQTHLAMWWKDFAENSHNRLARKLVKKEQLNLWKAARLFALLNMAICDAYINVFDNKFHFNHWRPYTAIRWAQYDGNPRTIADTSWNNLHKHTYAFPSYPSAHGCASAAAMTILADVFGKDYSFTMITDEVDKAGPFSGKVKMDPPERSFKNFQEAARECGLSRVYLGIHFRYDSEEGVKLGEKIGSYILSKVLVR